MMTARMMTLNCVQDTTVRAEAVLLCPAESPVPDSRVGRLGWVVGEGEVRRRERGVEEMELVDLGICVVEALMS